MRDLDVCSRESQIGEPALQHLDCAVFDVLIVGARSERVAGENERRLAAVVVDASQPFLQLCVVTVSLSCWICMLFS